jgi:bifunctional UDP-N-acetylglucosamine pyrophosphorylase/glucosamine-1-phosphate N-acetyltransferase
VLDGARIGTFVEVTRSEIGRASDILHLSYVGDAVVGDRCSIGTGSVTVNFDGREKHRTILGDDVHLGSKTSLVAPVEVESGADFPHNASLTGRVRRQDAAAASGGGAARKPVRAARKRPAGKRPAKP